MMSPDQSTPDLKGPNLLPSLGWVRLGMGIAAAGYALVVLARVFILRVTSATEFFELAAALLCAGAFMTSARWPRRGGLFVIGVIWLELTYTLYASAATEVTSLLVYPFLVLALGLLLGERWAIGGALVTGSVIPLAVFAGRYAQGIQDNGAATVISVVMVEIILVCAGLFSRAVLRSFRQLLENSERLRGRYTRLFQDMPDGLLEIDPAGRIVEANAAAEHLFAADRGKLAGQMLADVLARSEIGPGLVLQDIRPGLPVTLQAGGRQYEVAAGTPPDAAGSALLVVRDVTSRHQIMEKQALLQRLETVGQLAGGIAHEYNNLLTAIGGNAGLLKVHPDPDVQRFATQILIAQQRAANLTRQMQAFSRHDFHLPEVISLSRELLEWSELLRHLAGERCRLELKGEGAAWVKADPVQVEQILVNLINNARDATPPDGAVEIRLNRLARADAQRLGSTLEAGWQIVLEVADRGTGMTPEVKSRLFEPFFTTKPPGRGTGLGLAAVHGLVTQNGGAIEIETEPGRGTTARIFLPEVPAGERTASGNPLPAPNPAQRHVLLVDDDVTACRTAVFALEQAGFQVTIVDNGFEAVKFFRQSAVGIDLVIASAVLPVLAGRELGERLRKLHPGLPILYVCGRFDLPAGWPADEQAFPLLIKPFRAEDLLKRVEALLPPARKQ